MNRLKLEGLDGSHLFGFLATCGLMRLLQEASWQDGTFRPQLYFDQKDYCAVLAGVPSEEILEKTVLKELQSLQGRLSTDFGPVSRPSDLTQEVVDKIAGSEDRSVLDELAGLGCNIGGEAHESTLCAANGAGHQNLVVSMRDVLGLLLRHPDSLRAAMNRTWTFGFQPTSDDVRERDLGNRKPTLRLDPSDERLYALRLDNPTSNTSIYRTELGAQALAAAAFGGLPVVPRQRHPVTIGSVRRGTRTYFHWGLWGTPASYPVMRSYLSTGMRDRADARARGFFAAFRVARVTGSKGKLSFAPTEPLW